MQCTQDRRSSTSAPLYVHSSVRADWQDTPRGTPKGRASPLPPHQAAQSSASAPTPRYIGLLLYPAPSRRKAGPSSGVEALGLLERTDSKVSGAVEEEELDPAGQVAVNPRFGLVAVGTSR